MKIHHTLGSVNDRHARRRRRSLAWDALESRITPAVTYHGGPVITAPEVQPVFLGNGWTNNSAEAAWASSLDQFAQALATGSYLNLLNVYGSGRGSSSPSVSVGLPQGVTSIRDADIQAALEASLHSGLLSYDANRIYVVYVDQNVEVTAFGESSGSEATMGHFSGYHDDVIDPATGDDLRYAVVTWPGGGNQIVAPLSWQQLVTVTTSHELAEAAVNPDPITNPAWFDDHPPDPAAGDEIADIAWGNIAFWDGYAIQGTAMPNDAPALPSGSSVIDGTGTTFSARPFGQTHALVATFTDLGVGYTTGPRSASDFEATIDWGNGRQTSGQVTQVAPGEFEVSGFAPYTRPGDYAVTVVVRDVVSQASTSIESIGLASGPNGAGDRNVAIDPTPGRNFARRQHAQRDFAVNRSARAFFANRPHTFNRLNHAPAFPLGSQQTQALAIGIDRNPPRQAISGQPQHPWAELLLRRRELR